MFEDKRFKNDSDNANNFFTPSDNVGLKEGNDNLNFGEQPVFRREQPKRVTKPKKEINSKAILKILIILLILALLGTSGYILYIKMFNNPIGVYKNVINYGFDYTNAKIDDFKSNFIYDKNKDIISSTGSFSLNTNLLEDLKGYQFKYKLTTDLNKEMIDSSLTINKDDKKVLDIEGVIRDKNLLINSKDIYNKYLQIKTIDDLKFNTIDFDYDLVKDILNSVRSTLINNLDKNKMNTKKMKLNVQNKNISVISNNYKLNSDDVKIIYQNVIDSLINNNEIIDKIADLLNIRKAEVKDLLNSLKTNEMIINGLKDIEFNIYTYGLTNKVIGGKILFDNKELINYTNFKDILNIKSIDNKLNIEKNNKEIKLNYNNILDLNIVNKDNKRNIEFSLEYEKLEMEGNLILEVNRVADKKVTTNILLNIKGKNDKDDFDINLMFDNITQIGGVIGNIPKSNIVDYNALSEIEKNDINNKIKSIIDKLPYKDLFIKDNDTEPINYCDIATNCNCLGSICNCTYLDSNGIEQSINCLNKQNTE